MNGETTYKPNYTVVDDGQIAKPNIETETNNQTKKAAVPLKSKIEFAPSEIELISSKRHKLRLFDPKGIYTFRHIEVSYYQSFLHVLSMCISLFLIVSFYRAIITGSHQFVSGMGDVNSLNTLDMLFIGFIALYGFIKVKRAIFIRVAKFHIRYKLALLANAFNLIILNHVKLLIILLAFSLLMILGNYPEKLFKMNFDLIESGVMSDTQFILMCFFSNMIVIQALKYCGKGEAE